MAFAPIPELLDDIAAGRMVVVVDDEDRENEGDIIMAASKVRPEDVNFMARHARGLICLALTRERCAQLRLPPMVSDNTSPYRTNFTVSIEAAEGVTTGISAYDRAHTIRTAVAPDARPEHLTQPGHVFPLMAQPGGVLVRAGHTEAACDLALLAGLEPAGALVEILNEDGSMARRPQLEAFAATHGLKIGSIAALIRHRLETESTVERVDARTVGTEFGPFELVTYQDRIARELHFALVRGRPDPEQPFLVRVHVKDPLTDVLRLRSADHIALSEALARVAEEGRGAVVVLADQHSPDALLTRLRSLSPSPAQRASAGEGASPGQLASAMPDPDPSAERVREWRRNGAGAQILADLGARRLLVLGTPRRQVALSGFGLEVVDYLPSAGG